MARSIKKKALREISSVMQDLQEQIRRRAYQLYGERGRGDGLELDDWLRAEREVAAERTSTVA